MPLSKRKKLALRITIPLVIVVGVLAYGSIPQGDLVISPPPTNGEPGRWVHVEGAANTRDAGGYPTIDGQFVKRGMIYRSGKLNHLSSDGAESYRKLGVKTVIDFCNRLTPWPFFGGDEWRVQLASSVHGCPMSFGKRGSRDEFYTHGVEDNAGAYRDAFEILANADNYPVLYHCKAGTDRTGVMSALLLSLLRVDRDTIVRDFRLSEQVNLPGRQTAMTKLLDEIQAKGGIEKFLEGIGVTKQMQEQIRACLLETK
ncbi:MAG: tyrosine-protein phosphatase [Phycisphaerales bacterium]|nr:tyrosine-protein phosphatase [Phycisphaerales bacterium]MCB9857997.1 tyrosine-protein phosphatase [Phycisphaerales bacterium]